MYNVVAASAIVLLLHLPAFACGQRTVAVIQETAAAPKVLLAQATQQGNPVARPKSRRAVRGGGRRQVGAARRPDSVRESAISP